ncbi:protein S40-1-like [Phragmites australis]|uniref:protein S40-1-like n=1 Tax=Phragmites australis TaxID=29695 RepID=UPI002D785ACB|nr:protein S40-1-like [Phragmites australis]
MEEFQEADVLWPEAHHHDCHRHRPDSHHHGWHRHRCHHTDQQPRGAARPQSAPLRIPATPPAEASPITTRPSWAHNSYDYDDDDGMVVRRASGAEAAIVPPHVLAARRCAEERRVASSVCVGHGRTLKGRDLRAVRNAVLHMTGFLSSSDKY